MFSATIVDLLLKVKRAGADSTREETPLVHAVTRGMTTIVELLLSNGANINTLIAVGSELKVYIVDSVLTCSSSFTREQCLPLDMQLSRSRQKRSTFSSLTLTWTAPSLG